MPKRMVAVCTNCGQRYSGGTVTVWLKREETPDHPEHDGRILHEPKDDVSFRCVKGCDEVHQMEVRIRDRY